MIEFRHEAMAVVEEATYHTDDLSLIYRHRPSATAHPPKLNLAEHINAHMRIDCSENYLIMADTLAIMFSRETRALVAFDAYSNCELWRKDDQCSVPEPTDKGGIYLAASLPDGRHHIPVSPTYSYCGDRSLLRICLGQTLEARYYRVSNQLVVGVSGGQIASLLLQGLLME
jgi:hypothetical protein